MRIAVRFVALAALLTLAAGAVREVAFRERDKTPSVVLWAWERPEDLEFIDTRSYGVAFLAKTLVLRDDQLLTKPRLQPLKVKDGTTLTAVVRIEADQPTLSQDQLDQAATEIIEASKLRNVSTVQIDFDATTSQREFYRRLLQMVRDQLPKQTSLSITALASWCAGDNWIHDLPIDEAVPMFFRMGVDKRTFQSRLQSGTRFVSQRCQNAAGVSTDEVVKLPDVDRLYVFSPTAWSQDSLNRAMEAYKR
jgi:hypothetical protein